MAALAGMRGIYGAADGYSVITAPLIGSAPTLLLFLALQRYFVRGLTPGLGK
jgi:ABC-type glycerol-3-phosphate transport system permease component